MPTPTVTLDTSKFEAAVKFVFEQTTRSLPEIINRAALVTIIGGRGVDGVMKRTPRALAGAIMAVPAKEIAGKIRAKTKGLNPQLIAQAVDRERKRRIAAIGYTAVVGWAKAAEDLGGRIRARSGKGYASMGYATPASPGRYEAIIANTTPAAELIGVQPLQDALNDTAQDMIQFWQQKTGAAFHP